MIPMKMNAKFILISLLVLFNFACSMQVKNGNGEVVTREFEVGEFDRINAGGNYKINLIKAEKPLVVVTTDDNLLEWIEIDVQGDQLFINSDYHLNPTHSIEIEIYYTELQQIVCSGASMIEHREILKNDNLTIDMSGAGAIDLNLDVDELNINLSGAGAIGLKGYVYSQEINLSGAGTLEAKNLESRYAEITISGIGNAKVNVKKELSANISGLGNIEYFGNPEEIHKNISGMGKIKRGDHFENEENI